MELSFAERHSADASFLAKELEYLLLRNGIPASSISLRPSSPENMDIGSILSIDLDTVMQGIGAVANVASFAKCIYDVVTRHNSTIVIVTDSGKKTALSPSEIDTDAVKSLLLAARGTVN